MKSQDIIEIKFNTLLYRVYMALKTSYGVDEDDICYKPTKLYNYLKKLNLIDINSPKYKNINFYKKVFKTFHYEYYKLHCKLIKTNKLKNQCLLDKNTQYDCYTSEKYKSFLISREWRSLRFKFLLDKDRKCACCGRNPKDHGIVIHVDHIIPASLDWDKRLDVNNLQLLCEDCNLGKSNKYIVRF
ncbi:MAG: HNH endonuclease [Clostridia bacterium]|jgi:5-methylcytosine-specific restriction endonuclease McrA|nr:HNH endonuclease [Clostridia bacterium]